MKIKQKTYYFFEPKDKKEFKKWLVDNDLTQNEFAEKCGISVSYLTFIITGKRHFTKDLMETFKNLGLEFNLGD